MSAVAEIGGDKQTIEGSLYAVHTRLKCYANDELTILDDIMLTIESYYKVEKHIQERMKGSLQKSFEHAQNLSYLGSSAIGASWSTALKELMEHYAQREASYPVLKQVILENLRRIRHEKVDEHNKVLLYDEEIIKEMVDIERRAIKAKRAYDDAYERLKQKDSGIKRLHQKILLKNELEIEIAVGDARNMYILQVNQMDYALKFYIEQYLVELDKLLVCDLFPQIKQVLDDLVYSEYKCLHDILQRAMHAAIEDGDEQKRHLLPKTFHNYPLFLPSDQNDQINTDDRYIPQLSSVYVQAMNDAREADQQIQLALESSVLNAQLNKDSRMDSGKIRLKRMEMRKSMASFVMNTLENLVPDIKTAPTCSRPSRLMGGLRPFMLASKPEINSTSMANSPPDMTVSNPFTDLDSSHGYLVPTSIYPCQATVLYDFEAANSDEMSVRQGDTIFIEAKPEHEGWLVAKGRERSGLVPESYVQLIAPPEQAQVKTSGANVTKNKSIQKNKKSPSNATTISSSPSVVDDEADYFSDD